MNEKSENKKKYNFLIKSTVVKLPKQLMVFKQSKMLLVKETATDTDIRCEQKGFAS